MGHTYIYANLNNIKSIKNTAIYTAIKNQQSNHNNFNHKLCLISNTKLNKWRVMLATTSITEDNKILLNPELYSCLKLQEKDKNNQVIANFL